MSRLTVEFFKKNSPYIVISLSLFLTSCATGNVVKENKSNVPEQGIVSAIQMPIGDLKRLVRSETKWVIMDPPLRSPNIEFFDNSPKNPTERKVVTKNWAELNNPQIVNLLSNTRAEISVGKIDSYGKITYLPGNLTRETGSYKVIMDYTNYIVDDVIDPSYTVINEVTGSSIEPHKIGDVRVGVGLRLTANITTNKNNVNLGGLMALGLAANSNKVQGYMHIDTIGIRLKGNSGIILSSTTIDESSILKAVETLAIIQSKIADETTHLDPQVIWVKPISDEISPNLVAEQKYKASSKKFTQ